MKAGGAGERGSAHFAGVDDRSQLIDEGRAHGSLNNHIAM
jgi:hypothetical protein